MRKGEGAKLDMPAFSWARWLSVRGSERQSAVLGVSKRCLAVAGRRAPETKIPKNIKLEKYKNI